MIYGSTSSCTVVSHGTRSEYQCRLGYEIISEDTSTNKRKIKLQLEVRTTSATYTTWGVSQTPTIDGVTLSSTTLNLRTANSWQVLGSREITITGAFSGTKTGSFTVATSSEWALKSGSASVTLNLDNLHTPPVINSVNLTETNSLLKNYTGIAQYLSVKTFTFNTSTYDNAKISSYQVHHNGVLIGSSSSNGLSINFDNVGTLATFEMNSKTYCTLKFVVIDSYGTSTSKETQIEVTKYNKPNLVQTSSSVKRNGQLTGKVKLSLTGSFFKQSINGVANTITLQFAYWKKGATASTTYYSIPFTPTSNNISLNNWSVAKNGTEITDVDKNYAYNFKIKATDSFNRTSEITLLCPVGEYLWAEFKDRVDFKKVTIQGKPIIIDKAIKNLELSSVEVTTSASATLLTHTITEAGTYLIVGMSPLNRYNQTSRELHINILKNNTLFWQFVDVSNAGWTIGVPIAVVQTFNANDVLKVTIENGGGKQWSHGLGSLQLVKL